MKKPKAPIGRRDKRSFGIQRSLAEARRLFPQAHMVLSTYPGVIGVGVGWKTRGGVSTGRPAFIATVRHKGPQAKGNELPTELLGIPVDVQVEPEPPKLKAVAGGQVVKQPGQPPGRLGCLVKDAAGRVYGLTALHVLVQEQALEVFRWANGPHFDVRVDQGGGPAIIGKLRAGEFTGHSDIACVELASTTVWQAALTGTSTVLDVAADPGHVNINAGVTLVPGTAVRGIVSQYPYAGDFRTDAGLLPFTELMKFSIVTPQGIPDGWSGSMIFDSGTREPLALLSFGSDTSDGNGLATAYGFPLFAFYAAWNLRPV